MESTSFLPKLFRWVFTVCEVLTALAALCIVVCMLTNPSLPPDAHLGPIHGYLLGQEAEFSLAPPPAGFAVTAFDGHVTMHVAEPAGFLDLLKRNGLPLVLVDAIFFTALFELLRRLFRNVSRGDSFTRQSVRLVQVMGVSLIAFSIVSGIARNAFAHATYAYLRQHTDIAVSGTPVQLPALGHHVFGHWFGSTFWFGLLVLALAEVFRQGLALKSDNDLTV